MQTFNLTLENMPHREKKLLNIAKVENMRSSRSNKEIPNQFIITLQNGITVFQSYNSIICVKADGEVYLDYDHWNYSKTTSKYRNIFLNESTVDTVKKIGLGQYGCVRLNK
tara:strand:+ start:705 stop:1037 length:333 start_codon:yes stop_codon:yes gene_type:complete